MREPVVLRQAVDQVEDAGRDRLGYSSFGKPEHAFHGFADGEDFRRRLRLVHGTADGRQDGPGAQAWTSDVAPSPSVSPGVRVTVEPARGSSR